MTHRCFAVLAFVFLVFGSSFALGTTVQGRVYVDVNANGRPDAQEPGVPRVLVSDGLHVVASHADGRYRLDCRDDRVLLRLTPPRDHTVVDRSWRWIDGKRDENFGLLRQEQPEDFLFLQITDTHIGREDLLREFAGFPEYHTGMLCGNWWKWTGPNPDGTPRGVRIVQIQGGRLKTAYANREGTYPLYVAAPLSTMEPVSRMIDVELVVIDFGKTIYDPRYPFHDRHRLGDGAGAVPEEDWCFCLP